MLFMLRILVSFGLRFFEHHEIALIIIAGPKVQYRSPSVSFYEGKHSDHAQWHRQEATATIFQDFA